MTFEALESLQQSLNQILNKHNNDLITPPVKQEIISMRSHAIVLQLLLKSFPVKESIGEVQQKERIREVANTTRELIEYILSEEKLSDCASIEPTVRLSSQLRELAEKLESTAGDVVDFLKSNDSVKPSELSEELESTAGDEVDFLKSNDSVKPSDSPDVSSSSRPAPTIDWSARLSRQLKELAEKLKSTAGDVVDFLKSNDSVKASDSPDVSSSSRPAPTSKDVVVGFDQDLEVLKDRLLERSSRLKVLPIVGMGGIGKTTLAKIVYNDPLIAGCFDVCAWVTISQVYSVGSIVVNLLASLKGISAWTNFEKEIPMESLIRKYLEGRRYLIVLDDVWSKKAWDDVKMLFPDNNRGSWIILTTRLQDVVAYAVDSCSSIHTMRLLDSNHSWNLLHQKVFADENCPLELEDVAKKIVKDCGGLPLSLVLVAGLLSKIPKSRYLWKQIAANDVQLETVQPETIICLSYTYLPDHSKACFLYMAAFPEDYEIHVSELIKLWVAEGFIKCPNTSKSLEKEAEDCLEDLVERSLVLVSSRKFDGKIKSCSLHDSVREFCIRQAGKEKVILPVMDYLPTPILRRHFLPRLLKDHHSISASSHDLRLKDTAHSSHIRTIICISQKGYRSVDSVEKFSSLRIFHVLRRSHHLDWEPGQVFDLIHLTYLASNIPSSIVPPAISKLQNLETLIIYRSGVHLPVEIWKLRQLKYLIAFSFDHLPHPKRATLPLENLQTLSLLNDFLCSKRMLKKIPNIQKLGIRCTEKKFDAVYYIINLTHLLRLENLKLELRGPSCWSWNHLFPVSLKKLTLSGWGFDWSSMTIVGSLPNLQVLKLRNLDCSYGQWKTNEGEFVNLRFLLIDKSDLRDWTTESSHFPRLECLILYHCNYLYEIPKEIGDIPTMKLIEVDDDDRRHWFSAKSIEHKQQISGNYSFQLRVKRY